MLPIILALAGGYLIVDSQKDKLKFEDGGKVESMSDLSEEFQNWCDDNDFPQMSADELLVEESIKKTPTQKEYLREFIKRWDNAAEKMADGGKMAKGGVMELSANMQDVLDEMKEKYNADDYDLDVDKQEVYFVDGIGKEIKGSRISVKKIMADGGKMAKGGMSDRYSTEVGDEVIAIIKNRKEVNGYPVYARVSGNAPITVGVFPTKEKAMAKAKQLEKNNKMADGGKMAKGGELVPYIIWVSKDGDKRELFGTYKSQRAAEMAMKKLWDSSDYAEMGNKPKSKYEKEGLY
jgi:hypothetical protein